jgi:Ca-activated chloride channel family protein
VDVDTASYSYVRKAISDGRLPQAEAVRLEELINYFKYDYDLPGQDAPPFSVAAAVAPSPFADGRKLMRIGIKGRTIPQEVRPPLNLVLLVDVSGSMSSSHKLPLLNRDLVMLAESLQPHDRVSIVTCAGYAGTVLMPTTGDRKQEIINAIQSLGAGGSTAGSEGIREAYALAEANYDPDAANRVILASDGDFNVGITDPADLESFVAGKGSSGVFLTVLGFGQDNLNDSLMQRLAQKGNGVAAYIDNVSEARRVLAAHDRQGRQDPSRVQPDRGRGVPPHRVRDPHARA